MVLPPGYSLWLFSYKPFMWCRPDARLRHYYSWDGSTSWIFAVITFSYKPFLWRRSDARLRHACCSFTFYKPFTWCRLDARLRHYYFCVFRSRSHSDTRLAPVLLFLHLPLEESFKHSFDTSITILQFPLEASFRPSLVLFCSFRSRRHSDPRLAPSILLWIILTTRVRYGFGIFSWQTCDHMIFWSMFDIYYTRVLNVCEYIPTYSLACPWLLSWPDSLLGDKHRGDNLGTYVLTWAASRR